MPKDDYARAIIGEGQKRGISARGIQIALATALVESNLIMYANSKDPASLQLPHEAVGSDGMSVGLFQQQNFPEWGTLACRMNAACSAGTFYDHLVTFNYNDTGRSPGTFAQRVQRSSFPDRYDEAFVGSVRYPESAQALYDRIAPGGTLPNRPDFNEYPMWSPNASGRNGRKVDLFLLHTQEGDGNADSLAKFLQGNQVSYHYTISEAADHGVTVVDVVDTDSYSWSVLSANPRSINLCFAGSRAAWSRADWLKQSRAIDVAAFIAVQDCKKYGIPLKVLAPPYAGASATSSGISDHNYVTKVLKDGSHTDVGPNFPWDVFAAAVTKYASGAPVPAPQPGGQPVPAPNVPNYDKETWDQIRGRWAMLGDQTLVEALAEVRDKVCGTDDADKPGVRFD